jgi:hypothetical protein
MKLLREKTDLILNFFKENKLLLIILLGVILLRIPTLFEPNRYADEDIYLTIGQGLRKGLVLYRDIHDNKPPLIYILAAFSQGVFGFRLILLFWNLLNVILFWFLAQKILVKKWAVISASLIFAILSNIPLLEGNISNGEIFLIMPATLAMLLIFGEALRKKKERVWVFALAGLSFSCAFLFKVPVVFDFGAACLFLVFFAGEKSLLNSLKYIFSPRFLIFVASFFAPIILSILYYWTQGAGGPYVKGALLQNIAYLSSWSGGSQSSGIGGLFKSGLVQRGLLVLAITAFLYLVRRRVSLTLAFSSLWFIYAFFGAFLSFRPYPHYLLQVIVPASLILVLLLVEKKYLSRAIILGLLALATFFYIKVDFWYYKSLPYYQNFAKFALRLETRNQYFDFFGKVNRNYQIAQYVVEHSSPTDKIFVWGTEPAIYALSGRLPVGRYTVEYHVADFNGYGETMDYFKKTMPKLIITFPDSRPFPELYKTLREKYILVKKIDNADIYLRAPQITSSISSWQAAF